MVFGSDRFGAFLRALRTARRLTLEDVERATLDEPEPVTRSLLSRLENVKARISTLKLLALARVYRVRLAVIAERLEQDLATAHVALRFPALPAGSDRLIGMARRAGRDGRVHEALRLYEMAQAGCPPAPPVLRLGLAELLVDDGSSTQARALLEAVEIEALEPPDRTRALYLLGRAALDCGQTLLARGAVRGLDHLAAAMPPKIAAGLQMLLAELSDREGSAEASLAAWLAALDAVRAVAAPELESLCLVRLAGAERRRGASRRALLWSQKALKLAKERGLARHLVEAWLECGRIQRTRGRHDLARQAWREARRLAREGGMFAELFRVYLELWRLARSDRDPSQQRSCERSLRHLTRFLETWPVGAEDLRERLDASDARRATRRRRAARAGREPAGSRERQPAASASNRSRSNV